MAVTSDELVTVATFGNPMDASVARSALEAMGIPAHVPGENLGVFSVSRTTPALTLVELKVRASDCVRALKVLEKSWHK